MIFTDAYWFRSCTNTCFIHSYTTTCAKKNSTDIVCKLIKNKLPQPGTNLTHFISVALQIETSHLICASRNHNENCFIPAIWILLSIICDLYLCHHCKLTYVYCLIKTWLFFKILVISCFSFIFFLLAKMRCQQRSS